MSNHHQLKLISSHPNCEVKQHLFTNQNGLFATTAFTKGDIIIDGGNTYFTDTDRRFIELSEKGYSSG